MPTYATSIYSKPIPATQPKTQWNQWKEIRKNVQNPWAIMCDKLMFFFIALLGTNTLLLAILSSIPNFIPFQFHHCFSYPFSCSPSLCLEQILFSCHFLRSLLLVSSYCCFHFFLPFISYSPSITTPSTLAIILVLTRHHHPSYYHLSFFIWLTKTLVPSLH